MDRPHGCKRGPEEKWSELEDQEGRVKFHESRKDSRGPRLKVSKKWRVYYRWYKEIASETSLLPKNLSTLKALQSTTFLGSPRVVV